MRKLLATAILLVSATAGADVDKDFWKWFVAHTKELEKIKRGDEPIADQLHLELQKVNPTLTFEMQTQERPYELIVSADGIIDAFPAVQRLVAAAPKVKGWKIIAFRPRKDGIDKIQVAGRNYKLSELSFLTVGKPERKVDVAIFAPGEDDATRMAVYLFLDTILGEYDVETRLAGIEIVDAKRAPAGARPIKELVKVVDALPR